MSLKAALAEAAKVLPRLEIETLIMWALGCDRAFLYAHPEKELTTAQHEAFLQAIAQRQSGKPIQYITGHCEFRGLDFVVSPAVLIPRPETEHSVETVVELLKEKRQPAIVDVGTGSGCIALALASELPDAEMTALEISAEALAVARENASRLGLSARVKFLQSDLLGAVLPQHAGSFDCVVSNPPYVGADESDKVQRQVKDFEPHIAVFSGKEGLDIFRRLIPQACDALKPGGWLVLEIGYTMEARVREMLAGWDDVRVTADLQGIPRVVAARKPSADERLSFSTIDLHE